MTHIELKNILDKVIDPSSNLSFKETDAIKNLIIKPDGVVSFDLYLDDLEKDKRSVQLKLANIIKRELNFKGLSINFIQRDTKPNLDYKYKYIAISSGKGGVGKSTFTVNLAKALTKLGYKTGIIDSDVYGASIPLILNMDNEKAYQNKEGKIIPAYKDGIEIVSPAFFIEDNKPVMWRGPLLKQLLSLFYDQVDWFNDTKIILIDLPPGTGDVAIDLANFVPNTNILIITTPNKNASQIALKAGLGSNLLNQNILGVVENMSYYFNYANNKKDYIFGRGGGKLISDKLNTNLLGKIPFETKHTKKLVSDCYLNIAKNIIKKVSD